MQTLLTDLKYAARTLASRRSFTLAALLTVGLGIGMTTTVFSFLDAVVLRPLPLRNADRLITLCETYPGSTPDWCGIAPPNLMDIRARSRTIEALGFARSWSFTLTTASGAENIDGGLVTDGVFEALGIRAARGRLIEPSDLTGGPGRVAVISHAMWMDRFGGRPDVVGRSITLDGDQVTIVGVLEPGFSVPLYQRVGLWRPVHIDPRDEKHREWRGFVAFGRLREGVTIDGARAELSGITREIKARHYAAITPWQVDARTLHDLVVGDVKTPLKLFFGAVALVLLIACANVANLLLARGATRSRELAVRSALGASRGRIVRALFLESLLLGIGGAVAGLAIAIWAVQAFKKLAPAGVPRIENVGVDAMALLFSAVLAIATAALFGLLPSIRASRVDLAQALREGGRSLTRSGRLGRALVIAEVAIALPLVISATLLTRSFLAQMRWEPGFEREHVMTFSLMLPSDAYKTRGDIAGIWSRLEEQIRAIPGVAEVGTSSAGPLFGGRETWEMEVEGLPTTEKPSIRWFDVSPGFFSALGVPLVHGTDFDATDVFGARSSGLVNETLAQKFWPNENPLGKHLTFRFGNDAEVYTVRGVVRDIPPLKPGTPVEPQLYWSNRQAPRAFTYFLVRSTVPPAAIVPAIRERITAVNRSFEPGRFVPMTELVDNALREPKFSMLLIAAFGMAALVLAGIGTYGLFAYFVEQQRREIGIQLALGADGRRIIRDIVARGWSLAVPGAAIGLLFAFALGRLIRGFLSGVSAFDPLSMAASIVLVLAVATVACLVPAWKASRTDPAATLVAD